MMTATAIATATLLLFASPIMGFTAVSPHRPQYSSSLLSSSSAAFKKSTLPKTTYCYCNSPSSSSSLHAIKEATFGMGCFWEPAESLLKLPGVLSTTVGYTGCTNPSKPPPTYDTVCFGNDYVEAVRVVYDDTIISYTQLLNHFFEYQKPGYARQYSSVIFVNNNNNEENDTENDERKMANEWKNNGIQNKLSRSKDNLSIDIVQIEPLSKFYKAETYHQRYWEKQRFRAGLAAILLAGSSGAFDQLELFGAGGIVGDLNIGGYEFDTICNGVFLIGAAWMILERLVVQDVRELKDGDLIQEVI
jgi:methionine-S-sulfoxide reductase